MSQQVSNIIQKQDNIRDFLGHSSVQTTEIYAKLSVSRRIKAIEAASKEIVPIEDVAFVVRSLGGIATIKRNRAGYKNKSSWLIMT